MKTLKTLFFLTIIVCNISILNAQTITWQKIFGGPSSESGRYGIQTFDGDYIILNLKSATDGGPYLLDLDQYGVERWNRIIDTGATCTCIQQTQDSGFIVSGSKNNQGLLIKTDRSGSVIWKNFYSLNNLITAFTKIRVTENGNFIVCGHASFFPVKAFVMKLDSLGNLIWQNILVYGGDADAFDITINADKYIYISGTLSANNFTKTLFAKLNPEGEFLWFNSYGLEGSGDVQGGISIVPESNRDIYITGPYKHSSSVQAHFTKIDSSGNVIFQNVLPQANSSVGMCLT